MTREVYLDNSATTALSDNVKKYMREMMEEYGNPSSLHRGGMRAREAVELARKQVGAALGLARPRDSQIIFTSSGTEADNLAIIGAAMAKKRREGNVIITTDSEHPAVEAAVLRLCREGFEVVRIPTAGGALDMEFLLKALVHPEKIFMISIMMVNNETGALYRVKDAFSAAKQVNPGIITHCDAVQGFLKCGFGAPSLCADLISLSSHKIHGPKGAGALYISPEIIKAKKISPIVFGGGQEYGLRSGTENVLAIAGFGEACREGRNSFDSSYEKLTQLREYAEKRLSELDVRINAPKYERAPHILSVTLPAIKSQTMLNFLSERGVYVSSGSACSSHSRSVSRALTAFGLPADEADSTIRISLSALNEKEDIDIFAGFLREGIETLIRFRKI